MSYRDHLQLHDALVGNPGIGPQPSQYLVRQCESGGLGAPDVMEVEIWWDVADIERGNHHRLRQRLLCYTD